ncbi:MAG TPA: rhodanese-like domain-containing protein [Solirubrobacteraceae bacterium]|jgi:hydroxyacylglutathione hydrolase/adenylyltransferase/sulfurtransferase
MSTPSESAAEEPSELEIDPAELVAWRMRRPELQIVDVRERYEREAGHIQDSGHIELTELSGRAGELDRAVPIVFYCRVGSRSGMAAQAFRASGFRAHSLRGGLLRWTQEQRPLIPADGHVADH